MKATIKGEKIDIKPNGIIRQVDDLGRVVIPKEYRRVLGFEVGDELEIIPDYGAGLLVVRKFVPPVAEA